MLLRTAAAVPPWHELQLEEVLLDALVGVSAFKVWVWVLVLLVSIAEDSSAALAFTAFSLMQCAAAGG